MVKFLKIYYELKKIFKKYVLKYHLNNELLEKVCSIFLNSNFATTFNLGNYSE